MYIFQIFCLASLRFDISQILYSIFFICYIVHASCRLPATFLSLVVSCAILSSTKIMIIFNNTSAKIKRNQLMYGMTFSRGMVLSLFVIDNAALPGTCGGNLLICCSMPALSIR